MYFTALVTIAAILFYVFVGIQVASAHQKYGVQLPATSGHPDFERMFRIQMNMLEWMPVFLPLLWLCAFYLSDAFAALVGLVWTGGRVMYFIGYREAVDKRLIGFQVQAYACGVLLLGALAGMILKLLHG
jgi:glutathione S-transferase